MYLGKTCTRVSCKVHELVSSETCSFKDYHWNVCIIYSQPESLAIGCEDRRIYLLNQGDLNELPCSVPFKDTIQALSFDRTEGKYLACLSDDNLLRIFTLDPVSGLESEPLLTFPLSSRGVSLCFHSFLTEHILIAEESGAIRFLNLCTQEWIFSVYEPMSNQSVPRLVSADWNPIDPNLYVIYK